MKTHRMVLLRLAFQGAQISLIFNLPHEELDTHHKSLGTHKQSTPRAGEGLPAGAARLGRAALQHGPLWGGATSKNE